MPHARARCQPDPTARRQINESIPAAPGPKALAFALVQREPDQWIAHTASRRLTRPQDFLQAVNFMVGAGFCPGAGKTTIRIAEDIAARMPRSKDGTVAYCLDRMVRRLGLSRRCITTHVGHLRALGLLAWVEKGSARRNALRSRHGDGFGPGIGFKRTATIYAPVAPPLWDQAHGRRLAGTGYRARVIGVTGEGRALAVAEARGRARLQPGGEPVDKPGRRAVDNPGSCTPSVRVPQPRTPVAVGGGKKDTAREHTKGRTGHRAKGSSGRTVQQALWGMIQAREVQLRTWWTQGSCVRRLGVALGPLFAAGWSWEKTARELAAWNVRERPRNVAAYIAAEIRRRANTGHLVLPDELVRPYRQAPADEDRYAGMLAHRALEFAERWEDTRPARALVRSLLPPGRGRAGHVPRGLTEARPDQVLLTEEEFARLRDHPHIPRSCEDLWAEAEEKAAARLEGRPLAEC